ncbi:hypothetical protein DM02DRAFT_699974 [Periconia macrospinosa]|uniref:Myb-like domain-containing protein n=1 Tax=Periconia macrospinosa TaxID=97972 RepID=A0A2V1D305_9PLEO|nr:hypothetical protein DM02DRAFT_699974 [Periconia macrospinosa]
MSPPFEPNTPTSEDSLPVVSQKQEPLCPALEPEIALATKQTASPAPISLPSPGLDTQTPQKEARSGGHIYEADRDRFLDIRILYTQSLWEAVSSKRRRDPGDISMKLKYLGENESNAQLYIVIQCNKRVSKKVKKFFAQKHVAEDLKPNFRVHVIDAGPSRLANSETIRILGNLNSTKSTLCGMSIVISSESTYRTATLGGLILVRTQENTVIYGLTAGHPLTNLGHEFSRDDLYWTEINSESDDENTTEEDESIQLSDIDHQHVYQEPSTPHDLTTDIGRVVTHSFNSAKDSPNHDWAVVALEGQDWAPNLLFQQNQQTDSAIEQRTTMNEGEGILEKGINLGLMPFSSESQLILPAQPVVAITSHGLQRGTLTSSCSCLMISPSYRFVATFDFSPSHGSMFLPGDSGSWVTNETTGEVYGHVVTVDTFGEASVMPIHSTLLDIKSHIGAYDVRIPSGQEISDLQRHRKHALTTDELLQSWITREMEKNSHVRLGKRKAEDSNLGDSPREIKRQSIHHNFRDSATLAVHNMHMHSLPWSAEEDETLLRARTQGMLWNEIAVEHFPLRDRKSCRQRHEQLMEIRNQKPVNSMRLATAYMATRADIWTPLANVLCEKWEVVEEMCMGKENGFLTRLYRSSPTSDNDSEIFITDDKVWLNFGDSSKEWQRVTSS